MFCGNETTYEILTTAAKNSALSHAILLCGPASIGKTTLGKAIAKSIFCPDAHRGRDPGFALRTSGYSNQFCDTCKTCQQIENGQFPNFWFTDNPESWKLEQIRDLQDFLNTSGFTGNFKVALLPQAHLLTDEAANAMLKTLEEPPANRMIIFTAEKRENLMPTIASRVSAYYLNPVADSKIISFLETSGAESELAKQICAVSLGRPGRTKTFLEDKNLFERMKNIHDFLNNNKKSSLFKIFSLSEKVSKMDEQDQREFWEELIYFISKSKQNLDSVETLLKFDTYKKSYVQSRLIWDNFLMKALG